MARDICANWSSLPKGSLDARTQNGIGIEAEEIEIAGGDETGTGTEIGTGTGAAGEWDPVTGYAHSPNALNPHQGIIRGTKGRASGVRQLLKDPTRPPLVKGRSQRCSPP